jgi:thiamine biosynthesis lipoprotein
MGTVFSIEVRHDDTPDVRAAIAEAVGHLHRIDALLSPYRPDSQLSRLARGEIALAHCDPLIRNVLALCEEAEARSDGWFSTRYAGELDPTGLVKGWAIELASQILADAGAADTCINGGGDIQLRGHREPGRPWRIGISDPLRPGNLATVVYGSGELAIATSGIAERGHHIYNPHTGKLADDLASVTVLAPGLAAADACATAAFAMGDAARDWIESLSAVEAVATTRNGTTWHTTGFAAHTVDGHT